MSDQNKTSRPTLFQAVRYTAANYLAILVCKIGPPESGFVDPLAQAVRFSTAIVKERIRVR